MAFISGYSNLAVKNNAGAGTGATFNITISGTAIATAPMSAGGSGYIVGDQLRVTGGNNDAILTVATVTGTAVASVTITASGSGYSTGVVATSSIYTPYKVDMTADWIVVEDGSGNTLRVPMTTTVTMDKSSTTQTSTLPNYRDQAATFPVSTWIYIWAIYNPAANTIAGLLSLSPNAPTLPSGYTHAALAGAVYNDSSGNFITFRQTNNLVWCGFSAALRPISYQSATVFTAFSVPVPEKATSVLYGFTITSASTTADGFFLGIETNIFTAIGGGLDISKSLHTPVEVPVNASRQHYYKLNGSTGALTLDVIGWRF